MSGIFGLDIALGAIRANQLAMNVAAHNIANANTKGYRRQEVHFAANDPVRAPIAIPGAGIPQLGTGVGISAIRRSQTSFLDRQINNANQYLGTWDSRYDALQQIEGYLAEPGDSGLRNTLDKFWNSWTELATSPESLTARTAVYENGVALADRIRSLDGNMYELQQETDRTIISRVDDINRLAQEIASLNSQIGIPTSEATLPNDLMDKRDLLAEELAQIVKVEISGTGGGDQIISLGGASLVQGSAVSLLTTTTGASGFAEIRWADTGSSASITGGEMKGLFEVRDDLVSAYRSNLDTIAQTIIDQVNAIHTTGLKMDGTAAGNFFSGTNASNIDIDPALVPAGIAAGTTAAPKDNSVADAIAGLRTTALIGTQTIGEAYESLVAEIGSNSKEASTRVEAYNLSVSQLTSQRDSVAGVSLDEEMINMTKFEQAYNAAARIFTVIDEMMDMVINRMGIAGR